MHLGQLAVRVSVSAINPTSPVRTCPLDSPTPRPVPSLQGAGSAPVSDSGEVNCLRAATCTGVPDTLNTLLHGVQPLQVRRCHPRRDSLTRAAVLGTPYPVKRAEVRERSTHRANHPFVGVVDEGEGERGRLLANLRYREVETTPYGRLVIGRICTAGYRPRKHRRAALRGLCFSH